ncbi:MAG: hypothetical protein QW087_07785 [Methanomassiliicoccales archaeon]
MISRSGFNRIVEVDYDKDPYTDHEIIKGIDRRVGEDYGLGAADLAFYILESMQTAGDSDEVVKVVTRICSGVIEIHRIARSAMFEERMATHRY